MSAPPAPTPDRAAIASALFAWFDEQGRPLSIRSLRDPWAILVVEVMSQQTQIRRVEERLPALLAAFPSPPDVAGASTAVLLRSWAGLGYNRRAVALRAAARTIVERHDGSVPMDIRDLEALPGVGPYTARAVAARAFRHPVAALDVNVRRVIGRMLPPPPLGRRRPPAELQALADALVDRTRPGSWNDAVMDLAASTCGPREPACSGCPVRAWCATGSGLHTSTESRHGQAPGGDGQAPGGAGPRKPPGLVDRTAGRRRTGAGAALPYPLTRRWLRGRLVAELRELDDGSWLAMGGARAAHTAEAVAEALRDLEREGLVELDSERGARLR